MEDRRHRLQHEFFGLLAGIEDDASKQTESGPVRWHFIHEREKCERDECLAVRVEEG